MTEGAVMTRSVSKLTMSSSSTDTQLSAYKLKPPTYHGNELQEVTSCIKETVRITPPPHDGVALRPTVLTVENQTPNGIAPHYTNYLRNARSSSSSKVSIDLSDKQCQTDDVIVCDVPKSSTNGSMGDAESTGSSRNDINAQFISSEKQYSNDTRSLDHIDVIVTECKPTQFQESICTDTIDKTDSKVVYDVNHEKVIIADEKFKDDRDEDSCCVKCFLFTLRLCDCCVIV